MKSTASSSAKGRVKWDEENLTENEQVKKEINARVIEEPKTPFHSPFPSQTDLKDFQLDLDEYQAELDAVMADAGLSENNTQKYGATDGDHKRVSFDATAEGHDATENPGSSEFKDHRKQHYDMKEALQKGKCLRVEKQEKQ